MQSSQDTPRDEPPAQTNIGSFKFAWAQRQFNYVAVLIGAAPEPSETDRNAFAARPLAVLSYNRGIRAYYFGLAMLSWFLNPVRLIVAIVWVLAVFCRREFRSRTLKVLCRDPKTNLAATSAETAPGP